MPRLLAILLGLSLALSAAAEDGAKVAMVKGKFADIKQDLVVAIEQRGLVINTTAHIGEMLERTGRDLGKTKKIYDQAEVIEFCSATASRTMMEADPRNIIYCPYTIAIYTLPAKPGVVYLAYRSHPETAPLKPVVDLLKGIVADVSN